MKPPFDKMKDPVQPERSRKGMGLHDFQSRMRGEASAGEPENFQGKGQSPEREHEQEQARRRVVELLSKGDLGYAGHLVRKHRFPDEFLRSEEIQAAVQRLVSEHASGGEFELEDLSAARDFLLPEKFMRSPEILPLAEETLLREMENGNYEILQLAESLPITAEFLLSPELKSAVRKRLLDTVRNSSAASGLTVGPDFIEIAEYFGCEDILKSQEFQAEVRAAAKRGVASLERKLSAWNDKKG